MNKFIIVPDSFKGTMTSNEICQIIKEQIIKIFPDAEIKTIPVSDGGEGCVDAFVTALNGQRISLQVKGPHMEELTSFYGKLANGWGVIEMAAVAGLTLVGENQSIEHTTTYGVGQMIEHAAKSGIKKLIIGLGGSATNDGGTGAAAALGVKFIDKQGKPFIPVSGTLEDIKQIDISGLLPELDDMELVTLCDIDNPLCGPTGAAVVFGPQKGASKSMIKKLDDGLRHLANIICRDLDIDILDLPGAGAAGGMGGGMAAFFGSKLEKGIDVVLETVGYEKMLHGVDMVITGEGKIDTQSLNGKVVIGVARKTLASGVPVIAIVGDIGDDIEKAYEEGIHGIFSINRVAMPYSEARFRSKSDLALTVNNLMRFYKQICR